MLSQAENVSMAPHNHPRISQLLQNFIPIDANGSRILSLLPSMAPDSHPVKPLPHVVLNNLERAVSSTSLESQERVVSHVPWSKFSKFKDTSSKWPNQHPSPYYSGWADQVLEWNYLFQFIDQVQEQRIGEDSRPKSSLRWWIGVLNKNSNFYGWRDGCHYTAQN